MQLDCRWTKTQLDHNHVTVKGYCSTGRLNPGTRTCSAGWNWDSGEITYIIDLQVVNRFPHTWVCDGDRVGELPEDREELQWEVGWDVRVEENLKKKNKKKNKKTNPLMYLVLFQMIKQGEDTEEFDVTGREWVEVEGH